MLKYDSQSTSEKERSQIIDEIVKEHLHSVKLDHSKPEMVEEDSKSDDKNETAELKPILETIKEQRDHFL